ncbi:hypothetical protein GCM10011369_15180 [Neiella marina]|uniref:Uncharacterized protein n=1 Tax=Neiella marina TaxID=508461 RepID=A0A8J2XNL9_9GAMM|nr:hypothetical protein [Neiella marina]GGA74304.1 hypothetical protein GCM10011369_15180 [Neiella marina]
MMILIEGDDNAIELEFHLIEQRKPVAQPEQFGSNQQVDAASEAGALLPNGFELK